MVKNQENTLPQSNPPQQETPLPTPSPQTPQSNKEISQTSETPAPAPPQSIKEQRVKKIASLYYSRKDVLNAIYKFSQNREISPRYFEGFGKRPDSFQYTSDISTLVKRGATSFHCSEEHWEDPLELSTDLTPEKLAELRIGWDLIIDIDCPWIDYSKKAALAIIQVLEHKGVKNLGVKFSGSKGFHIIVPWQGFPKQLNDVKTSEMFPEWPKAVINYLKYLSRPIFAKMIESTEKDFLKQKDLTGVKCESCHNLSEKNYEVTLRCPNCNPPYIETFQTSDLKFSEKKCPTCKKILNRQEVIPFFNCIHCNISSLNSPENFNEEVLSTDAFKILGLDILLVSSRHLFRMPYSLHEKTALASIVLSKEELENFNLTDANPLNVKIKEFFPHPEENESENLLIQALDWQSYQPKKKISFNKKPQGNFKKVSIPNPTEDLFPPVINKILKGAQDGKKRALFILMNFFRSLGMSIEDIEKRLNKWNKLNSPPLKQGYINSQLVWHSKNKIMLPPNFDNPIYKEIGVFEMDNFSKKLKNPVNYTVRKFFLLKRKK
ncbi:MAG: hypothetical protein U9Q06_02400 [Nanoarchaeota archaeon]|nr:hypothetical protein [Nanoarchaeota archaeon]